MARWLPTHQDAYFLRLQAAAHGAYQPQSDPAETEPPKTKEGAIQRALATARRLARASAGYRDKNPMRGR